MSVDPEALVITCAATVTERRYNPLSTQKAKLGHDWVTPQSATRKQ